MARPQYVTHIPCFPFVQKALAYYIIGILVGYLKHLFFWGYVWVEDISGGARRGVFCSY
jgi:hypothetical protein